MKNNIILRKFDYKNDLDILFNIMINSNDQMLFHGRIQLNSVPDFEKWFMGNLTHGYHDFYVVEDGETKEVMGYIYSYEFRPYDGHCKVCTVLTEKYRAVGVGAVVGLRFLNELFSNYPLRKVYIDVYDYNKQSLQSNIDAGFVEEGLLKNFRYENGEYHDMHVLGLTRERFYEKFKGILNNVK
jgi:RimJ/RimL family protein N-acetyltransferase